MTDLGRYKMMELLGNGSMGTVHRALDPVLEREVAIKTIRTGLDVEPAIKERFYREAKACARLQHPSIITVFDLGEMDNTAFIVMELLHGADWRKLIKERRELPLKTKLEAAISVCHALSHAHRHGIIHRDVKPSNLFQTHSNGVKVLDFGIARLPSSKLTFAHQILGTTNYMPPELVAGKPADARSDFFSAAIVFFEFLTFRHPFESPQILKRIVDEPPDSIIDADPTLPVELDRIFQKALSKEPNQRYRNGDAFAAELFAVAKELENDTMADLETRLMPLEPASVSAPELPKFALPTPPPTEDTSQLFFSEIRRLTPDFEENLSLGNRNSAQNVPAESEAIETASVPRDLPKPPPKLCPFCHASNRPAAIYCISCGASLPSLVPPTPAEPQIQQVNENARSVPLQTGNSTNPQLPRPSPPTVNWQALKRIVIAAPIWLVAVVTFALTTSLMLLFWAFWPSSVKPALATATVTAWRSAVYRGPSPANPLEVISHDQIVQILELPTSPNQQWVRVQLAESSHTTPSAFMPLKDLGNWRSDNPSRMLSLLLTFKPHETATSTELNDAINRLAQWLNRNSTNPRAPDAHLALAQLYVSSAKADDEAAPARADHLQAAAVQISSLSQNERFQPQIEEIRKQIDLLQKPAVSTPPPPEDLSATAKTLSPRQRRRTPHSRSPRH